MPQKDLKLLQTVSDMSKCIVDHFFSGHNSADASTMHAVPLEISGALVDTGLPKRCFVNIFILVVCVAMYVVHFFLCLVFMFSCLRFIISRVVRLVCRFVV